MKRKVIVVMTTLLALSTVACTRAANPSESVLVASTAATTPASSPAGAMEALPIVVVHKSPSCGCCGLWVDHLRAAGFEVQVRDTDDLNPIKESVGVPVGKGSCHTAQVGGYFVEGHVPAEDIKRLLAQKPDAKGLVLPGMPAGSPGMEMPDGSRQPYTVELVGKDGMTTDFASH